MERVSDSDKKKELELLSNVSPVLQMPFISLQEYTIDRVKTFNNNLNIIVNSFEKEIKGDQYENIICDMLRIYLNDILVNYMDILSDRKMMHKLHIVLIKIIDDHPYEDLIRLYKSIFKSDLFDTHIKKQYVCPPECIISYEKKIKLEQLYLQEQESRKLEKDNSKLRISDKFSVGQIVGCRTLDNKWLMARILSKSLMDGRYWYLIHYEGKADVLDECIGDPLRIHKYRPSTDRYEHSAY